jgi:transposase InsO family protein
MPAPARQRRTYDHRLREYVCRTGVRPSNRRLEIPRSTIATWKHRGLRSVVSIEPFGRDREELLRTIGKLERRARILAAVVRLLLAVLRVCRVRLADRRLPDGGAKTTILRAIAGAEPALPLHLILRILRLSPARYHVWRRAVPVCGLDDRSSCPRTMPSRLTVSEIATMKDMVLDPEYRHMPLRTLSVFAQRAGKVFASVGTWARLARERGWRRPRNRVHPAKPILGLRATRPDQYWHVDATILRLLDGTRACVHAVIDNFSRKVLAWTVAAKLAPAATCDVLAAASRHLDGPTSSTTLVADSGVENVNAAVDAALASASLRRVLAQVEVSYSNSMIEAWWRSLKHQWLFLNSLETIGRLRTLVAFFVNAHNTQMPHSAFRGQTPDEMYLGTAPNLVTELAAARAGARERRLAANRSASCARCPGLPDPVGAPLDFPLVPSPSQLRT